MKLLLNVESIITEYLADAPTMPVTNIYVRELGLNVIVTPAIPTIMPAARTSFAVYIEYHAKPPRC